MAARTIHDWLQAYGVSHQNPTNKLVHWICVPLIFFSILGLLASIPAEGLRSLFPTGWHPFVHWGSAVFLLVILFYLRLSPSLSLGVVLFGMLCFVAIAALQELSTPLWAISLIIFAAAWIGQFWGHKVEGAKPSFFEDVQFLLIGPAWLLSHIYKQLGIRI